MTSSGQLCEEPRCRLCWGDESEGDGKLVSPCNCRGSMGYIHIDCLKHWLETTRQQGRSRQAANRCEICHSKYKTGIRSSDQDQLQLMPSPLHDPYTIASIIHGSFRAYIALNGLLKAYSIYRSIQFKPAVSGAGITTSSGVGGFGMSSIPATRSRIFRWRGQPATRELPLHQLSVSVPFSGAPLVDQPGGQEVLAAVRSRFDKATMVQVYWYTSLMAVTPQPPNADAFAGMAIGATIGGIMAQMVFLPMLGAGKLSALGYGSNLLLRCLIQLIAADACGSRAYSLLAAAVRAVMQGHGTWRRRLAQQLGRLRLPGRHRPRVAAAAAENAAVDNAAVEEAEHAELLQQGWEPY